MRACVWKSQPSRLPSDCEHTLPDHLCQAVPYPGSRGATVPGHPSFLAPTRGRPPFLLLSRQKEIAGRWRRLLQCLQEERKHVEGTQAVLSLLQGVEAATDQLGELQVGSRSAELWEVLSQTLMPTATQHLAMH